MRYLSVLLLAGCTQLVPIDYDTKPPADWPQLEEKIAVVSPGDIPKYCRGLGAKAKSVQSCAVTSFRYGVCYIYLVHDEPAVLEHERAHCHGYGHVGDATAPAAAWLRYKQGQN